MVQQCWAIIALKWIILKHTFSTGKLVGLLVGGFVVVAALTAALAGSAGAFLAGWRLMGPDAVDNMTLLAILDAATFVICFVMVWGLLIEVQRSDLIDFRKMLHFPVSLPMIFSMNFVSSLFAPGFLLVTPVSLAFLTGLALSRGAHMLLGIPLALAFIFMAMAWQYYARGLFAMLMEHKRRWRVIMGLLPFVFFIVFYSPAWVGMAFRAVVPHLPPWLQQTDPMVLLTAVNAVLPPLWFPYGVAALDGGEYVAACAAFLGLVALMAMGLSLGYRAMRDHCLGRGRAGRPMERPSSLTDGKRVFTAGTFPFLANDTAALARAAWLHYARLPNLRTAVGASFLMGVVWCFMMGINRKDAGAPSFMAGFVMLWPYMSLSTFALNLFGADYGGFRCQVLMPTARHKLLLARNLAFAPILGGLSLAFSLAIGLLTHMAWIDLLTWILLAPGLYLLLACLGNYTSTVVPYALPRSALRRNKTNSRLLLAGLVNGLVFAALALLCMGIVSLNWLGTALGSSIPLGPVSAVALLLLEIIAYPHLLRSAGGLLQRRELRVLEALTRDRE